MEEDLKLGWRRKRSRYFSAAGIKVALSSLRRRMQRLRRDFEKLRGINQTGRYSPRELSQHLNKLNTRLLWHQHLHRRTMKYHSRLGRLDRTLISVYRMAQMMNNIIRDYRTVRKGLPTYFQIRGKALFYVTPDERQKLRRLLGRDRRKRGTK